ncbi:MAG: VanZ family protein [Flavobacteriales bacterium]|nr:VanZ family protein [Flavobacteriales bacterium]
MKSYFPSLIWGFIILVISGYPGNYVPKVPVWQFDKIVHWAVYSVLSVCLLIAWNKQYMNKKNRLKLSLAVVFIGAFYGGFMEFLQDNIFINRSGNWFDFIANTIGAIMGVLMYPLVIKYLPINRWFKIK